MLPNALQKHTVNVKYNSMKFFKIFCTILLVTILFSFQDISKFNGVWEIENKEDSNAEGSVGFIFTDSSMIVFMTLGGGLDPISLKQNKFTFTDKLLLVNDSLKIDTMMYRFQTDEILIIKQDTVETKLLKQKK